MKDEIAGVLSSPASEGLIEIILASLAYYLCGSSQGLTLITVSLVLDWMTVVTQPETRTGKDTRHV